MKIIVTGATGFIGRNLAVELHADGHEVIATGRSESVGSELEASGVEFHAADLRDGAALRRAFRPADCVVHCAAKAGDWGTPAAFHEVNVAGTRHVVAACDELGIRDVVFLSSPSIYYNGADRLEVREDAKISERHFTSYAKTKLASERELLSGSAAGRRVIVFRPRAVYGPHDQILVPRILALSERRRLPLINGGSALTDVTYVGNLVDAVRLALQAPSDAWNEIYNISNGEPISIADWFGTVLQIFDRPMKPRNVPVPVARTVAWFSEIASRLPFGPDKPMMTRFSVSYMAHSMTLSIDKARTRLGYQPRVGNQEGFERYAAWVESTVGKERHGGGP